MPKSKLPGHHHSHDKGYKQLLSNKKTFLELIKYYVRKDWVKDISENELELLENSFILYDFTQKEADIVYRLKLKEQDVIFYILLELQSTVDYLMPFRLLMYMTGVWWEIYKNTPEQERERKDFRLPVIVPVVLYNGAGKWTAPLFFKEMLGGYKQFIGNILDFKYVLINVNSYRLKDLYKAANLISTVFALDQKIEPVQLVRRLRKLAGGLKEMSPDEFRQLTTWLRNVLTPGLPGVLKDEVNHILSGANPQGVELMIMNLEVTLEEMRKQAEEKGIQKGKQKGLLEGKLKGKLEVARAALIKGFSLEDVVGITGLDRDLLAKLEDEINAEKASGAVTAGRQGPQSKSVMANLAPSGSEGSAGAVSPVGAVGESVSTNSTSADMLEPV